MNAAAPGILEDFIASEDEALVQCKQGDFYPPNHHLIKPLISTADTLLGAASCERLYFHLLRVGELPPVKSACDFELLRAAYAQTVPLLAQGFPSCSLQRAPALLLFGYDDHGALCDEAPCTAESYRYHAKLWAECNAHSAIPYMIRELDRFALYAADAALVARIVKLLRRLKYLHSDYSPRQEARYPVTRLWFWGLVFTALLGCADTVVGDFLSPPAKLPRYAEQLRILSRYAAAAGREDLKSRLLAAAAAAPVVAVEMRQPATRLRRTARDAAALADFAPGDLE